MTGSEGLEHRIASVTWVVHDERVNTLRIDNRQWPSLVPGALCTSYNPALVNPSTIKLEIDWNVHAR